MRKLAFALALAALGLALGWARGRPGTPMPAPHASASVAVATLRTPGPPPLPVRFRGDAGAAAERARHALERVLATSIGQRAQQLLESGALPEPLTIEVNHRGDQLTRYRVPGRELGETILLDPERLPLVETEAGPQPALPETVLAHELGHAVFKLVSEEAVIQAVENPIREALGLPRRVRF